MKRSKRDENKRRKKSTDKVDGMLTSLALGSGHIPEMIHILVPSTEEKTVLSTLDPKGIITILPEAKDASTDSNYSQA